VWVGTGGALEKLRKGQGGCAYLLRVKAGRCLANWTFGRFLIAGGDVELTVGNLSPTESRYL